MSALPGFSHAEDLAANPALKFAEGADDTGVIVSWNTDGPGNKYEGVICKVDNKKVDAMKLADTSFEEVARTRIKAWFANAHS